MRHEQKLARLRAEKTGEGYTTALMHIRVKCPRCGDGKPCPSCALVPCLACQPKLEIPAPPAPHRHDFQKDPKFCRCGFPNPNAMTVTREVLGAPVTVPFLSRVAEHCRATKPDPRRPHQVDACGACASNQTKSIAYVEVGVENATTSIRLCKRHAGELAVQLFELVQRENRDEAVREVMGS